MENKAQGTIWNGPVQFKLPDSDYAGIAANVSFFDHMKLSDKEPNASRPADPSVRWKSVGTDWKRPVWTPVPDGKGILLNEGWKVAVCPPADYTESSMDTEEWQEVMVPAELMALGYDIRRDKEYVYKRQLDIPKEWQGSTLILKFGMVYEYCKIWVNGKFVREHEGAFTSFECDITNYVIFGQAAIITVMCMHRHDALCDWTAEPGTEAPGYAGLIDDVTLAVLPGMHLKRMIYDTELDDAYANAVLKVTAELAQAPGTENGQQISAKLRLMDPQSRNILSENCRLYFEDGFAKLELAVANPLKWCAEHPNLYRLEVILQSENDMPLVYSLNVGFRKAERIGKELYVNGRKTKLRGAALYAHDPIRGKVFVREELEATVKAAKWANINFFRSSAYPERAYLYELCDRYGLFVEECAPANFRRESS